jgi:hypothetical protein
MRQVKEGESGKLHRRQYNSNVLLLLLLSVAKCCCQQQRCSEQQEIAAFATVNSHFVYRLLLLYMDICSLPSYHGFSSSLFVLVFASWKLLYLATKCGERTLLMMLE